MGIAYDPRLPETIADPFPVFARLRREDPVHWSDVLQGWVLTRHADVCEVLTDLAFSSERIGPFVAHWKGESRDSVERLGRLLGLWLPFRDPPEHTRLRRLIAPAFAPKAMRSLESRIEAIVGALLDRQERGRPWDLIREFAFPVPAMVIADMLGVPEDDLDRFKEWSHDLASFVGGAVATPDKYERAAQGIEGLAAYFGERIAQTKRAPPGDGLMAQLNASRERGDIRSDEELLATCILILFARHETTTNLIGNSAASLMRWRDELGRAVREPARWPAAVEEAVRYDGPAMSLARQAREDKRIGEKTIRAGQRVFTMLSAANRDPEVFQEPDRFDVGRSPNPHIGFGHGIHFCIGAPLARLEGRIGLPRLFERFPNLRAASEPPVWSDSLVLRGMRSFWVEG